MLKKREDCCGCSACVQICPKNCITMKMDDEGFLYPKVEHALCIDCHQCKKVCPILQKKTNDTVEPRKVYIAYTPNDDIRLKSSSGGMFTLLGHQVLQEKGIVFGAAFDDDFFVHHVGVETEENFRELQGSKYLQSRIENTYAEAKNALDVGRKVLFSGTACQIAGLKKYLRKDYDNLLTVDVLCHGVPSPKVWKKYLNEQEDIHGAPVRQIFFRHKKNGWKRYSMLLEFLNNTVYECIFNQDLFMQLFLSDICLRPSCYNCKFKGMDRPSDITLGDCWGIEKHSAEMDDDKGSSVVLIHSVKGETKFDEIKNEVKCKEMSLDSVLPPTADSRRSVAPHPKRDEFFKNFDTKGVSKSISLLKPSISSRIKRKIRKMLMNMKSIFERKTKKIY